MALVDETHGPLEGDESGCVGRSSSEDRRGEADKEASPAQRGGQDASGDVETASVLPSSERVCLQLALNDVDRVHRDPHGVPGEPAKETQLPRLDLLPGDAVLVHGVLHEGFKGHEVDANADRLPQERRNKTPENGCRAAGGIDVFQHVNRAPVHASTAALLHLESDPDVLDRTRQEPVGEAARPAGNEELQRVHPVRPVIQVRE